MMGYFTTWAAPTLARLSLQNRQEEMTVSVWQRKRRLYRVTKMALRGLESHPQHDLARVQMPGGFGGMMSFEVDGADAEQRFERAKAVLNNVKLCISSVSLGSTETLITHPASIVFAHQPIENLIAAGVEPGLIRLSVGIEDPQDLVQDIAAALNA